MGQDAVIYIIRNSRALALALVRFQLREHIALWESNIQEFLQLLVSSDMTSTYATQLLQCTVIPNSTWLIRWRVVGFYDFSKISSLARSRCPCGIDITVLVNTSPTLVDSASIHPQSAVTYLVSFPPAYMYESTSRSAERGKKTCQAYIDKVIADVNNRR